MHKITQDIVKELFDYHEDGYLIRKSNNRIAGHENKDGYIHVHIKGKYYKLYRLIFLWHHGYMPENLVDHSNMNKSDNRIENLREVTYKCNNRNIGLKSNNSSGVTGVNFAKHLNKWAAQITINKRQLYLGAFDNLDDAVLKRHQFELKLNWKGCNSTSSAYLYLKRKNLLR